MKGLRRPLSIYLLSSPLCPDSFCSPFVEGDKSGMAAASILLCPLFAVQMHGNSSGKLFPILKYFQPSSRAYPLYWHELAGSGRAHSFDLTWMDS